jgi:DNA-binding response OmpR family regulator
MIKPPASSKQILCVDDDKDTCEMITIMLGYAGYEVTHVTTVGEGLSLARKGGFDLILLDWVFEDGSGLELCEKIRSFDKDIPILFYSGVAYESEIKKALRVGAQGFLVKPLGTEHLLETVSHFVSNNPDAGPHAD